MYDLIGLIYEKESMIVVIFVNVMFVLRRNCIDYEDEYRVF